MARAEPQLVIDARPRGPRGPLATELLLGRPLLSHLVEQVQAAAPGRPIAIHAREPEQAMLAGLLGEQSRGRLRFVPGPPSSGAWIVRTDRLYEPQRLRRALRTGRPPESAEIWRLDRVESLRAAEDELSRRLSYQPLGRFWAFALAERLASLLAPTGVHPNVLTLMAAALMLTAAGLVALAGTGAPARILTAVLLALALVLDTADGRLARLQGTCSEFGRWLDAVLDELADLALHAAIAWSLFCATGHAGWLILGIAYSSGKYLFLVQSVAGRTLEDAAPGRPAAAGSTAQVSLPRSLRRLVAAIGHADLRWHLWIVLAALGRLELALLAYAAYFPLRALGGMARKAAAHG